MKTVVFLPPAGIESPILFEKTIDIKGMGGSSAIKCEQVVKNIEEILAIELILATSQWKKKQFDYHSDLFKEYLSFMTDEEVTTLETNRAHHTFFNSAQIRTYEEITNVFNYSLCTINIHHLCPKDKT